MLEIPEAEAFSRQINTELVGREIVSVVSGQSPHKFAWYFGEPDKYEQLMKGLVIGKGYPVAGNIEIAAGDMRILFSEGINLRYIRQDEDIPKKHQLLIGLDNGAFLCASIQMYGGVGCFKVGENENPYYLIACEKPVPNTDGFTYDYFCSITGESSLQSKSAKAVLATEQRIPGLGNGVLQDILFNAKIHPKRKLETIDDDEFLCLYAAVVKTLAEMTEMGGRDTETDLFGNPGGYRTLCSKNTVGKPCPRCGDSMEKASYMGGSVYFCPGCQPL